MLNFDKVDSIDIGPALPHGKSSNSSIPLFYSPTPIYLIKKQAESLTVFLQGFLTFHVFYDVTLTYNTKSLSLSLNFWILYLAILTD